MVFQKIKTFVLENKWEIITLIVILLLAAWFRLFRIGEYMTFLGDEGRDARVVRNLLVNFDPVLIGPMTSVVTNAGHMYLGPLYYYLSAPFMLLAGISPVGPSVMVALFSMATMVMMWWLGRKWWHPTAGLVASVLYAVSPTVIFYSRSSWNPNIMPFFALLCIWAIYEIWRRSQMPDVPGNIRNRTGSSQSLKWWFIVLGVSYAFVLQSHYLGLLLAPTLGIYWLISFLKAGEIPLLAKEGLMEVTVKSKNNIRRFLVFSSFGLLVFLFLMSPLLIFDIRHDWLNFGAISTFFLDRQITVHFKFFDDMRKFFPILEQIYKTLITAQNVFWARTVMVVTSLVVVLDLSRSFDTLKTGSREVYAEIQTVFLILTWTIVGVFGLSIYQQSLFDHYFGFLFPAIFMLTGWAVWRLASSLRRQGSMYGFKLLSLRLPKAMDSSLRGNDGPLYFISILLIFPLLYLNLQHSPLKQQPNRQFQRANEITEVIIKESGGQPFNLALVSKQNYDEGYRYLLERANAPLVAISPEKADETITEQLFVVCENQPPYESRDMDCNPLGHPRAEIALFGYAQIDEEWVFDWGHKLYKLVPRDQPINN